MKWKLIILLIVVSFGVSAQSNDKVYTFQFSDKVNTPYSLSNPSEFLSQRALDRRTRQNISLDEKDLPVDPNYVQAVLNEGGTYLTHSKWFNSITVQVQNDDIRDSILDLPFVVNEIPVAKRSNESSEIEKFEPTDETKSNLIYTENDYGFAFNQIDMIGGVSLHNQGFKGEGMLIAVLDGGFIRVDEFSIFNKLRDEGRLIATWDFVNQNTDVYSSSSHGQSVLSTMAGYSPGTFIGTAPEASYILLKTEDVGSEFPIELEYWIAGAEFADSAGADIINSSLGYTRFDEVTFDFEYSDMDGNTTRGTRGADIAAARGILVVNSAGNSGNNSWRYIGAPSDGDSVLAVGAVSKDGFIANFSSVGPSADGDVKPNVCAQGLGATIISGGGQIATGNGTSFSGPIIAGMAACLWQANLDSATNMDVFHAIEQSAHLYTNPDDAYGYGIPNFAKANLLLKKVEPSNESESELFTVYPNPFADVVSGSFYASGNQDVIIRLVNSLGQEVRRIERFAADQSPVLFQFDDLQHLNEGIYTLQIQADSGKYYQKLMKVRD